MKIAIMQPYFFPYIGYFQLINAVDTFVVYDNIEYTKKGWINRNRILLNGKDEMISLPLKKDSDYLHINQRVLSNTWVKDSAKIFNLIKEAYRKAPFFEDTMKVVTHCLAFKANNLFEFLIQTIRYICNYLLITTKLVISSSLDFDYNLKSVNKVLAICKLLNADSYVNPIGGLDLYDKKIFANEGVNLSFLKSRNLNYKQYKNEFIPFLSIIDILMFNSLNEVKRMINCEYEIV